MESILEVKNLVKQYGPNTVIRGISFNLEHGKIYGLLGPNGAGKTTTMKLISNMIAKNGGEINGKENIKINYLVDVPKFYEFMTVREYLTFIADLNHIENAKERVDELLNTTNLRYHENKKIRELSRGLRQKLGIASVLINQVDILLLDEPVSALDPVGRKEVLDVIASLKGKMCVVFSSHILNDIEKVCDHIILINDGKIILNEESKKLEGAQDVLLVECDTLENAQALKEGFEDASFSSEYENTLEIPYKKLDDTQMEVLKAAKKLNVSVTKLEVKKNNLEDVFLRKVKSHA